MKKVSVPFFTISIALITLIYSLYVTHDITGLFFGKFNIVELESYGGVRLEHLTNFEIWRLFTSQIVHVKQPHMIFNVVSFLILGFFVERNVGAYKLFIVWFVGGALGTLLSTLFVKYPWNLGTGSSQAILAVAGCAAVLLLKKIDTSKGIKFALGFAVLPALTLDLIFAHYPKPGHVLGFAVGFGLALLFVQQTSQNLPKQTLSSRS